MARAITQLELGLEARPWSEDSLHAELVRLGAKDLDRVAFRATRRRIWSLTRSERYGTTLNLQPIFRAAPEDVVQALAISASATGSRIVKVPSARRRIRDWHRARSPAAPPPRPVACAGTPKQAAFLRSAFDHLNRTRFDGGLPSSVVLRFSARMTRRLGHMREPTPEGQSAAAGGEIEIALALELMLEGNEDAFLDTLLHEMAHAADFLSRGRTDHGPHWRMWAARVGCAPRRCATSPIGRRRRGRRVLGVPSGHRRLSALEN